MATRTIDNPRRSPSGNRLSVAASSDYLTWLARLAVASRAPVSQVVDQALLRYAEARGFEPPPSRYP